MSDRQIAARQAQAIFDGFDIFAALERNIDRYFVEQPLGRAGRG